MTRRPLALTIVGWLFVLVGGAGLVQLLLSIPSEWTPAETRDFGMIFTLRAMALAGGILVLRGVAWARWMLLAWMAIHVYVGLQHSWGQAATHFAIFSVLTYFLFRRS